MKTHKLFAITFVLSLLILSYAAVVFADIQGANTTVINTSTGAPLAPTSVNTAGGNLSAVNINGSVVTDRWAGFYGNISGIVRLADAAGNQFYKWTVNVITGSVVYATNGTVSNWSTLAPARYVDMPSYLQQTAADNYSTTFVYNETFSTNLRVIPNVNFTYTLNGSTQNSQFKTYALTADVNNIADDNSTLVFAGKAVQAQSSFNNQQVDFQIIAPARSLITYYFYLELP